MLARVWSIFSTTNLPNDVASFSESALSYCKEHRRRSRGAVAPPSKFGKILAGSEAWNRMAYDRASYNEKSY